MGNVERLGEDVVGGEAATGDETEGSGVANADDGVLENEVRGNVQGEEEEERRVDEGENGHRRRAAKRDSRDRARPGR